jgi:Na+/H+-dicarboxylate symporter
MSFIDYFAIFVLVTLIAVAIAIFVALGMAPGYFAKSRNHPYAQAVEIAGWVTRPLSLIWAFVDIPKREGAR